MDETEPTTALETVAVVPSGRYSTKAVLGLILAIVSIFFVLIPFLSWLIAIPSVILAHLAVREVRVTAERGREVAVAGLVIGYLSIAISLMVIVGFSAGAGAIAPDGQNHDACTSTSKDFTKKQLQACVDSYDQ